MRQLVGRLADHTNRKTWSETLEPSNDLQGLSLRDIDPSDLRQFLPRSTAEVEWVKSVPYLFLGRDTPSEDTTWVKNKDLPDISSALVLTDPHGIEWQAIDIDLAWSGKRADSRVKTYRYVSRGASAITCAVTDLDQVTNSFLNGGLSQFYSGPKDYRGYLGEYPGRWPYVNRLEEPIRFEDKDGEIVFHHLALRQLRGAEWEYDYSHLDRSSSLLMPSIDLVQEGSLRWDHRGGWNDPDGELQLQDPFWFTDERPGLLCRTDYMDRHLDRTSRALITIGVQMKHIAGWSGGGGRQAEETMFIRHQGVMQLIKRKVTID